MTCELLRSDVPPISEANTVPHHTPLVIHYPDISSMASITDEYCVFSFFTGGAVVNFRHVPASFVVIVEVA